MSARSKFVHRSSCKLSVLMGTLLMLAGCVSEYNVRGGKSAAGGGSSIVLVRPSKAWHKLGVSGKDAWETWQRCKKVSGMRKETDACMTSQGFTYGKTDDIYVPPPVPKNGWVKSGVGYVDAHDAWSKCVGMRVNTAEIQPEVNRCMTEQGFVYRKGLSGDELPPCWYDPYPPCRDEPRPY